ncbi:MAG: ABC transporter ATP-binding protein [Deferrisomatales bacterium]|nr:ABC transporter ATP-binding protein [Deferrisomatales bacterium]
MTEPILSVRDLVKSYGGLAATCHLSMDVSPGEVHAVIGPNGAGKTTLISQVAGALRPDSGSIWFEGEDVTPLPAYRRALRGLARSYQITSVFPEFTALQNVALAVQAQQGHSFRFWQATRRADSLNGPAREALGKVGLAGREDIRVARLGHGERRQLELAMVLASRPKLVLLDEPMAGMSPQETQAMTELLGSLKGGVTMLLVEHDMEAVFALADRISVLVYGSVIACGTPAEIRDDPDVRSAYLGEQGGDEFMHLVGM